MAIFGYCWVASWMTHLSLLFTLPAQNHIRDTDHVFQRLSQFWQQRSIDESETRKEIGDFSFFTTDTVSKNTAVYLDNTVAKVTILTHFSRPEKVTKTEVYIMCRERVESSLLYRKVVTYPRFYFNATCDENVIICIAKLFKSQTKSVCKEKRAWLCRGVEKYT